MKSLFLLIALVVAGFISDATAQTRNTWGVPSTGGRVGDYVRFNDNNGNVVGTDTISAASIRLNGLTTVTRISEFSVSVTPTQVSASTCSEQSVTISGLSTDDRIFVSPPVISSTGASHPAVLNTARVSTSNTAAFIFCNVATAGHTPNSGTYTGYAIRKS